MLRPLSKFTVALRTATAAICFLVDSVLRQNGDPVDLQEHVALLPTSAIEHLRLSSVHAEQTDQIAKTFCAWLSL